jgi:hypothetical protein
LIISSHGKEKKITSENIFKKNFKKNGEAFQFEDIFTTMIGQNKKKRCLKKYENATFRGQERSQHIENNW